MNPSFHRLVVSMIARNEADRHLERALESVGQILAHFRGEAAFVFTDDASDDDTLKMARQVTPYTFVNVVPEFWKHEGMAREKHYRRTERLCGPETWVLSLDADETISAPEKLPGVLQDAEQQGYTRVGMPLYEFWSENEYRTDGFWFGTTAGRLYKYQPWPDQPAIRQKDMGCGSEPMYVPASFYKQTHVHLLHWGYLREEDRVRKHRLYTERLGGHGHNNRHVESIVGVPTLKTYP